MLKYIFFIIFSVVLSDLCFSSEEIPAGFKSLKHSPQPPSSEVQRRRAAEQAVQDTYEKLTVRAATPKIGSLTTGEKVTVPLSSDQQEELPQGVSITGPAVQFLDLPGGSVLEVTRTSDFIKWRQVRRFGDMVRVVSGGLEGEIKANFSVPAPRPMPSESREVLQGKIKNIEIRLKESRGAAYGKLYDELMILQRQLSSLEDSRRDK